MIPYYNNYFLWQPWIPANCDKPPTMYSILNSIVNGYKDEDDYTKIKDLAKEGRHVIFNFNYPLSQNISSETFETTILNHYMMRRIGYETVTAFRIALESKLNEIMPLYNKMFDALANWNVFQDGETTTRSGYDNTTTNNTLENHAQTSASNTSDRRSSDTPQSQISNVQDASYITNYSYDTNTSSGTDASTSTGASTNNRGYNETITRTPSDKAKLLIEMQQDIKSIYSLIFKDLDDLFYGLV